MKRLAPLLLLAGVVAGAITGTWLDHRAEASRNSSGTYSLPAGNPVVSGTTISSTWANGTLSDISTELTNSLDRQGRGAMTAPLQLSSGLVSAPALTFSAGTTDGLYRIGANDLGMSINSTKRQEWTNTGSSVTGTFAVSGGTTLSATLGVTGNTTVGGTLGVTGASTLTGGVTVGSSGTATTGSFGVVSAQTFGSIGVSSSVSAAVTVTGASTNSVCEVSAGISQPYLIPHCYVSAANTVTLYVVNVDVGSAHSGTGNYAIRVWNF